MYNKYLLKSIVIFVCLFILHLNNTINEEKLTQSNKLVCDIYLNISINRNSNMLEYFTKNNINFEICKKYFNNDEINSYYSYELVIWRHYNNTFNFKDNKGNDIYLLASCNHWL